MTDSEETPEEFLEKRKWKSYNKYEIPSYTDAIHYSDALEAVRMARKQELNKLREELPWLKDQQEAEQRGYEKGKTETAKAMVNQLHEWLFRKPFPEPVAEDFLHLHKNGLKEIEKRWCKE